MLQAMLMIVIIVSLVSCNLSNPTMTAPAFERIPIGASMTEIETQVGTPYCTTSCQGGVQRYQYIERIETGPGLVSQNTYLLIVKDGQIIDKQRANESQSLNIQIR